jgi:hypothetical protein
VCSTGNILVPCLAIDRVSDSAEPREPPHGANGPPVTGRRRRALFSLGVGGFAAGRQSDRRCACPASLLTIARGVRLHSKCADCPIGTTLCRLIFGASACIPVGTGNQSLSGRPAYATGQASCRNVLRHQRTRSLLACQHRAIEAKSVELTLRAMRVFILTSTVPLQFALGTRSKPICFRDKRSGDNDIGGASRCPFASPRALGCTHKNASQITQSFGLLARRQLERGRYCVPLAG